MKFLLITDTPEEITGKVKLHPGRNMQEAAETKEGDYNTHKKSQGDSLAFFMSKQN